MEEFGYLGRNSHEIKFSDLSETLTASLLAIKIDDFSVNVPKIITLSLLDFYSTYNSLNDLEKEIKGQTTTNSNRNTEYTVDVVNFLHRTDFEAETTEEDLISFYNTHINHKLAHLKNGDTEGLASCIIDFSINDSHELHQFDIELIPSEFILRHSKNILHELTFMEKMYESIREITSELGEAISYRKQIDFAIKFLDGRQDRTGEVKFDFHLKEIQFRHALISVEDTKTDSRLTLPQPLTTDSMTRLMIPLYLESVGILEIVKFKLSNSPKHPNDLDIIFSVNKPAINDKFNSNSLGITQEQRRLLNENQLVILEKTFNQVNQNGAFIGRPNIEKQYSSLFYWVLKKVSYCLEEPSFLKEKAQKWLDEHKDDKYTKMEDDFLLPFLHERLRDEFGEIIRKKPEKFGGEVDILFDELPLELKVRKNKQKPLSQIIDEKYAPASQAATYASLTQLGFVIVLDLPTKEGEITNIDSCIRIVEKEFDENALKTNIIVCILHCNLPKPNLAK